MSDIKHMSNRKWNLLKKLVQMKFEESVYNYLNESDFQNMEELDAWLDARMRTYFSELDSIYFYYKPSMEREREIEGDDDE